MIKLGVNSVLFKTVSFREAAEAIKKSGYQEAVRETDAKLLNDIQKGIRSDFFEFVTGLDGTVVGGTTLQAVLAGTWGQLQVLFEDDAVAPVHFINPLTIADYLATASISVPGRLPTAIRPAYTPITASQRHSTPSPHS